jgi:hypothetical protein
MANNYYYLVAGLPDLVQDAKKQPVVLSDFREVLAEQLTSGDLELSRQLFLHHDNQNLLNLLTKSGKEFLPLANYTLEELEQNIKEPVSLEPYMNQFVAAYKAETLIFPELSWEDNLAILFFEHMQSTKNEFLRQWSEFDFNLRNVRTAINVRNHKLNPSAFILGDGIVAQALKKSTLRDFGLANDFPFIEKLLSIIESGNVLQQELEIDRMRWDFLDELNTFNYFSLEVVMAFILKITIIERWIALDPEVGQQMFDRILKDLKKSYEFSKEFSINERRKESN